MATWTTKDGDWRLALGALRDSEIVEGIARVRFAEGSVRIQAFGENITRITWLFGNRTEARPSRAVILKPEGRVRQVPETMPAAAKKGDAEHKASGAPALPAAPIPTLSFQSGRFTVEFRADGGGIVVHGKSGPILESPEGLVINRDAKILDLSIADNEHFYGLGEKTGFLDKRGRSYTMWNTDEPHHLPDKDPLYQSIPYLIRFDGTRASAFFLDSAGKTIFDLGFSKSDEASFLVSDECFDLYVMEHDGGLRALPGLWATLSGTMNMPPLWALGYQQSRWSYQPEDRVFEIAEGFRSRGIPCDVIYLDIDYMDGYRVFTWNRHRFPEPKAMSETLAGMGFHVVCIVDPGVKQDGMYAFYVDGAEKGLFCRLPGGQIYHGKVWPGVSAYPDFSQTATRTWWAAMHKELFDAGISGVWNDMNEPSDFSFETEGRPMMTVPDPVLMDEDGDPRPFAYGHNAYGLDMCRATVEAFETLKPGERPFVLTRAGYAGIQRYAAVWTGDDHSWWEHLAAKVPMLLNLGISGVPFVGGDAGGFQGNADPELFARWIQQAAFTPFFRAHSDMTTKPHEPWAFGPETEAIARDYIRLRYSLMPYIYSEIHRASGNGQALMRALVMEWPEDPRVARLDDQYMFGPSIMVAPVHRPGARERLVYLPEGLWYDYHSKTPIQGGKTIVAEAPLDRLPLFVRAGAIIPLVEAADHTGALDLTRIRIEAYAGAEGDFEVYEDDGHTTSYKNGAYNLRHFSLRKDAKTGTWGLSSRVTHSGYSGGCPNPDVKIFGV